jgi:hypothetical protein
LDLGVLVVSVAWVAQAEVSSGMLGAAKSTSLENRFKALEGGSKVSAGRRVGDKLRGKSSRGHSLISAKAQPFFSARFEVAVGRKAFARALIYFIFLLKGALHWHL